PVSSRVCSPPPTTSDASVSTTSRPAFARVSAAASPFGPAPTTFASTTQTILPVFGRARVVVDVDRVRLIRVDVGSLGRRRARMGAGCRARMRSGCRAPGPVGRVGFGGLRPALVVERVAFGGLRLALVVERVAFGGARLAWQARTADIRS